VIGRVTDDGLVRVLDDGQVVAELPIALLTDEVPEYELAPGGPAGRQADPSARPAPCSVGSSPQDDMGGVLRRKLASPNLCSRRFAFRQYDSTVQANTVFGPGQAAAAVLRVDGTTKGLAVTTDCNPSFMQLDPRRGAQQAVAEAVRNLACVGATPVAVTDCLNFGNPEKPLVAWQLAEAVDGLAEACRLFEVPIVSGNVSLYNETAGRPIPPTPTIGMVGLLEDVSLAVPIGLREGAAIVLLGHPAHTHDGFPRFDLQHELRLARLLRLLIGQRLLLSAQDISDGGLVVALAECCFATGVGATVDDGLDVFSEDQGRAIVSCRSEDVDRVARLANQEDVPVMSIGNAGGARLQIGTTIDESIADLEAIWSAGLA
jgi:phosphoribosylformylglycinamidine synthase